MSFSLIRKYSTNTISSRIISYRVVIVQIKIAAVEQLKPLYMQNRVIGKSDLETRKAMALEMREWRVKVQGGLKSKEGTR